MKLHQIICLFLLAVILGACTGNSDFMDNGSLAITAASTTLTPGGGTTVTAKYTITTNVQISLAGNDANFSSNRPDLITFSSATVQSDNTGAATTGFTVVPTAQVQTGGVDVVVTASFRGLSSNVTIHINPSTATSSAIKLTAPALADQGSTFAVSALLSQVTVGATVTFTSSDATITFAPVSVIADGSGTARSTATVKASALPQNGLDVTVTATCETVSDLQVVHVSGATPATFSIFPASLDISNVTANITKTIQIVKPANELTYNYSAASRAPFIMDVGVPSVNNATGVISLTTAATVLSCTIGLTHHTGSIIIEIKDNAASYSGPTLFYPVTYDLCW